MVLGVGVYRLAGLNCYTKDRKGEAGLGPRRNERCRAAVLRLCA